MAIWQPPPPNPFIGGRQPLAPDVLPPSTILVDTPPKLYDGWQLNAVRLWDPPPPSPFEGGKQPLAPRTLTPSLLLVPNPPFTDEARTATFFEKLRSWDAPDPWPFIGGRQPLAPRTGPPSTLLVDTPPKFYPANFNSIIRSWDPPPPWPVTALDKLIQELVVVLAANPPYGQAWLWAILSQWTQVPVIYQARNLSPGIPGQSVDQPPPQSLAFITQVKAWEPAIIIPQRQIYLLQPAIVVSADNPPFGMPPDWLYSILTAAWQPGQPLPKVLQKILQEGAAPVIASGQREKRKWRRGSS